MHDSGGGESGVLFRRNFLTPKKLYPILCTLNLKKCCVPFYTACCPATTCNFTGVPLRINTDHQELLVAIRICRKQSKSEPRGKNRFFLAHASACIACRMQYYFTNCIRPYISPSGQYHYCV